MSIMANMNNHFGDSRDENLSGQVQGQSRQTGFFESALIERISKLDFI